LCSGKTTLADLLRDRLDAHILYVRDLLRQHGASTERRSLQEVGAELEARTGGAWLAQAAADATLGRPAQLVVVDSVRTIKQLDQLKVLFSHSVLIYLTASPAALARRFKARTGHGVIDSKSYEQATAHPTERAVAELAQRADSLIDTTGAPRLRVFERVRRFLAHPSLVSI
jgi:adenylosuccinate synthase